MAPARGSFSDSQTGQTGRIAENFNVFDFALSSDQITAIDALDTRVRGGPEPDSITLETYGKQIRGVKWTTVRRMAVIRTRIEGITCERL